MKQVGIAGTDNHPSLFIVRKDEILRPFFYIVPILLNNTERLDMTELTTARWISASFRGWLSGVLAVIAASGVFDAAGLEGYQFYLGISMGGCVGFFQWQTLSKTSSIGSAWIWSTFFGLGMPFLLFDLLKNYGVFVPGENSLQYSIALGGAVTAFWQTLILKRAGYNASRWLLSGWAGWILAAATILAVDHTKMITSNNWALFVINLSLIISGGAVLGAVTGHSLLSIVGHKETKNEQ